MAGLTFVGWQETIGCGGVAVIPDDIVVIDDDGAVVIPSALLDDVLKEAPEQEEMEALIRDFPYLNDETRAELVEYMEDFFDQIDNRNSWRYFRDNCKSR